SAEAAVERFLVRGAVRLGPPAASGPTLLRDPGGAILALTAAGSTSRAGIASIYAELFGWSLREEVELGGLGRHVPFSWSAEEPVVGGISGLEGRPGV